MSRTWVILGATSIIAEEFAHLAANAKHNLILVGRNLSQLDIIAANIRLRYPIDCSTLCIDFETDNQELLHFLKQLSVEIDLFIAYSALLNNSQLTPHSIEKMVRVNILSTILLIHYYLQRTQDNFHLVFLSSVASCRGRSKNSLYGASKGAIEIYLQGLQQSSPPNVHITVAKLGFIDTIQTYGVPGVFYASPPLACAKACWRASLARKQLIYHPFFWRFVMGVIKKLPFFIYKRLPF